jgi:hypothetical protein
MPLRDVTDDDSTTLSILASLGADGHSITLGDVCPNLSRQYEADDPRCNSELAGDSCLVTPSRIWATANVAYLCFGQTRRHVGAAALANDRRASLGAHVGVIARRVSKEQVCRVDASRVVAAMTDEQALGNRTMSQFPRQPRRDVILVLPPHLTVAERRGCTGPQPARLRSFYPVRHSLPETRRITLPCAPTGIGAESPLSLAPIADAHGVVPTALPTHSLERWLMRRTLGHTRTMPSTRCRMQVHQTWINGVVLPPMAIGGCDAFR